MELNRLIAELENELTGSRSGVFTRKAMVDTQKCLEILDEIRAAIPSQGGDINFVLRETERIRRQAEEQAELILREAESRAAYLIDESNVVKNALSESAEIKRQTKLELDRLENTSRDRLEQMLYGVERSLSEALEIAGNSRRILADQKTAVNAANASAAASKLFEK